MTDQHPVTPPSELLQEWYDNTKTDYFTDMICAAQWGADQELVACGNYLKQCAAWEEEDVIELYNYRRPGPPPASLKEQALMALEDGNTVSGASLTSNEVDIIRRALEQLDD
jgi:hypothetical protein